MNFMVVQKRQKIDMTYFSLSDFPKTKIERQQKTFNENNCRKKYQNSIIKLDLFISKL